MIIYVKLILHSSQFINLSFYHVKKIMKFVCAALLTSFIEWSRKSNIRTIIFFFFSLFKDVVVIHLGVLLKEKDNIA